MITVLYGVGALALRFVLGEPAPAGAVPLGAARDRAAEPACSRWPVYALVRRLFPPADALDRVHEVRLLG